MATARQLAANLLNSRKSTGPKTDEGKDRAKANAFKHGLAGDGTVLAPGGEKEIESRIADWRKTYLGPDGDGDNDGEWLLRQLAVSSVQVEQSQRDHSALRAYFAARARLSWEEDRTSAAAQLGGKLARKPLIVSHMLEATSQGCDWLIDRWKGLRGVLDEGQGWTDKHRGLARDLMGNGREDRPESDDFGSDPGSPEALSLVDMEIERLESKKESAFDELNERERRLAELGLPIDEPKALALVKRYEEANLRRYKWARQELLKARANPAPEPVPPAAIPRPIEPAKLAAPRPPATPLPEPSPGARPSPIAAVVPVRPVSPERSPGRAVAVPSMKDAVKAEPPMNRRARRAMQRQAARSR